MRNIIIVFLICFGFVELSFGENYWITEQLTHHDAVEDDKEVISGAAEASLNDPIGGYVVAGFYQTGHHPFLTRIDHRGNIKWFKELSNWGDHPGDAFKSSHHMEKDGNDHCFLIGGNIYLRKVKSSNGDEIWRTPIPSDADAIHYMEKISNSSDLYLLIGYKYLDCWIFDGSSINITHHLKISDFWKMYCGKLTVDNKLIFSGDCNEQLTLCKTNKNLAREISWGNNG